MPRLLRALSYPPQGDHTMSTCRLPNVPNAASDSCSVPDLSDQPHRPTADAAVATERDRRTEVDPSRCAPTSYRRATLPIGTGSGQPIP